MSLTLNSSSKKKLSQNHVVATVFDLILTIIGKIDLLRYHGQNEKHKNAS